MLVSDEEECDGAGEAEKTEATSYPASPQSTRALLYQQEPRKAQKKVPCEPLTRAWWPSFCQYKNREKFQKDFECKFAGGALLALFHSRAVIQNNQKSGRNPNIHQDEWINTPRPSHTMEHYSTIKMNKGNTHVLLQPTVLEIIMLWGWSQTRGHVPRDSTGTEVRNRRIHRNRGRVVAARGERPRGGREPASSGPLSRAMTAFWSEESGDVAKTLCIN